MQAKKAAHHKCRAQFCSHRKNIDLCLFHKFPVDAKRCKQWLQVLGVEDLLGLSLTSLSTTRYLCSCHFKDSDYTGTNKRLRKEAVPSKLDSRTVPLSNTEMQAFPPGPSQILATQAIQVPLSEVSETYPLTIHSMVNDHGEKYHNSCESKELPVSRILPEIDMSNDNTQFEISSQTPLRKHVRPLEFKSSQLPLASDVDTVIRQKIVHKRGLNRKKRCPANQNLKSRHNQKIKGGPPHVFLNEESQSKNVSISVLLNSLFKRIEKHLRQMEPSIALGVINEINSILTVNATVMDDKIIFK